MKPGKLSLALRYLVSLALSAGLFLAINLPQPSHDCDDCFAPHGRPFTYYHEAGSAGGGQGMFGRELLPILELPSLLCF